jgi:DNA-3-methyladenine glycosylase
MPPHQVTPQKLTRAFYARPAIKLAKELIGTILVRRLDDRELRARIVETEAYIGEHDLACHASKGRTARTDIMFGPAGHAYVYLIYGIHNMLNIVASKVGDAQAVLVRAAEPLDGWTANLSGPGRLAKAMHIRRLDNGTDLTGDEIFLLNRVGPRPKIIRTKRIGVDYAGDWKHELLRFIDANSPAVSKPRLG